MRSTAWHVRHERAPQNRPERSPPGVCAADYHAVRGSFHDFERRACATGDDSVRDCPHSRFLFRGLLDILHGDGFL